MTIRSKLLLAWLASLTLLAPAARAGADVRFGAAVNVNDDTSLFLGVSSRYFEREPEVLEGWSRRVTDPDDLSVLFFLATHSRRSLDSVYALRRTGLSWWDVSVRLGVPAEVWFVPVADRPGPPYGKAYGHRKKHGHGHDHGRDCRRCRIDDRTARDLVAVRVLHEYYGVPVEYAMDARRDRRPIDTLVCDEYRSRHDRQRGKHGHRHDGDDGDDHDHHRSKSHRHKRN